MKKTICYLAFVLILLPFFANSILVADASNAYVINGVTVHYDDFTSSPNECWAYANNVYNKIWGHNFSNSFSDSENSLRNLSDSELTLTEEHLKAYVGNAALGSCLRICNSEYLHGSDGWGHSQIIVQKDANGFTVFEGGLGGIGWPYCREKYFTWSSFMSTSYLNQYSYIKYIKWPNAPAYSPAAPSVTASGFVFPSALPVGTTPSVSGTVNSNVGIAWLWAGVYCGTSNVVLETSLHPNSSSYSISALAAELDFASLPVGEYHFSVQCTSGGEYFTPIDATFSVVEPNVTGQNVKFPSTIVVGTNPTVSGTVNSNVGIAWLWAGVYHGTSDVVLETSLHPNSSSYSISALAAKLDFSSLPIGNYHFSVQCTSGGVYFTPIDIPFEVISPHSHTFQYTVRTAPTTATTGVLVGTCSQCGETTTVTLPTLTMTDYNYSVIVPATCTAAGTGRYTWKTTIYGTFSFDEAIPNTGHSYSTTITEPSCTAQGYAVHTCSVCGDSFKDSYSAALGHNYVNGICTRCGAADVLPNPFEDVREGNYFFNPVMWAVNHDPQITAGVDATHFAPNNDCTREQIVTFLWKANGAPEPQMTLNPFSDVASDAWYCKPVLWAVSKGYTSGMGDGLFGVGQTCTRAQAMTFLWAAKGKPEPESTVSLFTDVSSGDWFCKPILWAAENGVTAGIGDGLFGVNNTCTRAQIITFLYKVYGAG